jgi:hypothetical protein
MPAYGSRSLPTLGLAFSVWSPIVLTLRQSCLMLKPMHPVVITTPKTKGHLVREAAHQLKIGFTESVVPEQEHLVRFTFVPLDEITTAKLAVAVPPEAYAYRGEFNG